MTASPEAVVTAFTDATNRHDLDAMLALCAEDTVFDGTTPPDGVYFRYVFDATRPEAGHVRGVDVLTVREGLIVEKLSYVKG